MTRLLTAREVAEDLALVPDTILRWAQHGKLPSIVLPSGQIRFSEDDLAGWLEERRRTVRESPLTVIRGEESHV